jgi:hypothetical protein
VRPAPEYKVSCGGGDGGGTLFFFPFSPLFCFRFILNSHFFLQNKIKYISNQENLTVNRTTNQPDVQS